MYAITVLQVIMVAAAACSTRCGRFFDDICGVLGVASTRFKGKGVWKMKNVTVCGTLDGDKYPGEPCRLGAMEFA